MMVMILMIKKLKKPMIITKVTTIINPRFLLNLFLFFIGGAFNENVLCEADDATQPDPQDEGKKGLSNTTKVALVVAGGIAVCVLIYFGFYSPGDSPDPDEEFARIQENVVWWYELIEEARKKRPNDSD